MLSLEFSPVQLLIHPVMVVLGVYLFVYSLRLVKRKGVKEHPKITKAEASDGLGFRFVSVYHNSCYIPTTWPYCVVDVY